MSIRTATPPSSCPGYLPSSCTPPWQCFTRSGRSHTNTGSMRPSCPGRVTSICRRTSSGQGRLSGQRWPCTQYITWIVFNSRYTRYIQRHLETLGDTGGTKNTLRDTLRHSRNTRRHSETVEKHSETLKRHSETLKRHSETLGPVVYGAGSRQTVHP